MLGFLLACDASSGTGEGGIDTSKLFPVEDGAFSAYRRFTGSEYAEADIEGDLDEGDLVFALFGTGGCLSAEGWRLELRIGAEWNTASGLGAIHFDDSAGLGICGFEAAGGGLLAYDPPAVFWADGTALAEGEALVSGDWSVTSGREDELATYFGVFENTATFAVSGPGDLDGWVFHLADRYGVVMMVNADFTADLVYAR